MTHVVMTPTQLLELPGISEWIPSRLYRNDSRAVYYSNRSSRPEDIGLILEVSVRSLATIVDRRTSTPLLASPTT